MEIMEFGKRVFGYPFVDRVLKVSKSSVSWYRINKAERAMYVPPVDALRINPAELSRFVGAVRTFIGHDIDDTIFDWDNLVLHEVKGDVACISTLKKLSKMLDGKVVAADIETRNLGWDDNYLISIGFAVSDNEAYGLYGFTPQLYPYLERFLLHGGIKFIWHGGKFDLSRLRYCHGIRARVDEDTMLKHYVQVDETKGTHKLKQLGPIYLQSPKWDDELDALKTAYCRKNKVRKADFTYDLVPPEVLIPYMQKDCIATYRLLGVLDKIKEDGTDAIYYKLVEAQNVFVDLECAGMYVDLDHLKEVEAKLTAEYNKALEDVQTVVDRYWSPTAYHAETGAAYVGDFNSGSPKQLSWLLGKLSKDTIVSTDKAALESLHKQADQTGNTDLKDFVSGLRNIRKTKKYLDTYVYGVLGQVCKDGRLRGEYNLHGTATGRLSSSSAEE